MRQRGFALLELLIALVLVSLALGLTAQLLMESSQMLTAAAAEQTDAPMPLVLARIRGDVRASGGFDVVANRLYLLGHPAGTVVYEREGRDLRRTVLDQHGVIRGSSSALRGVTQWACGAVGPRLLLISVGHRRSRLRAGVLPQMPGQRGPVSEERVESILVAPRGAGLGLSW